jgi:enoyl-CoA hydratase/carnithine racemase
VIERDGNVAEVVLDRPPVNAFSMELYATLAGAFEEVSGDSAVDVVLLRSANPRIFSAGADIHEFADPAASHEERQAAARRLTRSIRECAQPTIAAVNGPALGAGAVVVASCDIRYASAGATIGLPEVAVARCSGATQLQRLLPRGVLRELAFAGEPLTAEQAAQFGAFNRVFPDGGALLAGARDLARRIGSKSPATLRALKQVLNGIEFLPHDDAYAVEQAHALRLAEHPDSLEAARAFLEKRAPEWSRT